MTRSGPSGGSGGEEFLDEVPRYYSRVAEVRIRAGQVIDSVQFVYLGDRGQRIESNVHGGPGGDGEVVSLGIDDTIDAIGGRYGSVVDSLTIWLNRRDGGRQQHMFTFGGDGGIADFYYQAPPGYEIAALCGRSANMLDAVGVVYSTLVIRTPAANPTLSDPPTWRR